ncbi:unnamed protein product [Candidula unifasciata]|uniref:Uncharacterized protein n=1 Tax=Candidula unifasciata TaxID=100452 RepID=A0A8S4A3B7_9EUPU|nr:unnamed protein product [Candidula unifasciata]
MPFNSHQRVSPYYSSKLSTPSNSVHISSRRTNASSSPLQHPQEQNLKLKPRSFSLSQVTPASLPLYSGTVASSNKGKTLLREAFFTQNDSDDMQPLDLSMRANRVEKTVKQPTSHEHKAICLVKSCTCSTQPEHLSHYHVAGQVITRSPLPGMTLSSSSREGSPLYTQHHMLSSTYQTSSSKAASFSSSVPQISPWNTTEFTPFQHLIPTDKGLKDAHNSSGLFGRYNQMHQDMNIGTCEETEQDSLATLPKKDSYDEENDEPTYMDLDSTTTSTSLTTKTMRNYPGNSNFAYKQLNSPQISSKHSKNSDGGSESACSPYQSPLLQALNSKRSNDLSDKRATNYFGGGVISHTSFEKSHKKIIGQTGIVPNSEKAAHPKQQLAFPDSSTSPATVPVSTGHVNLYRSHTDTHLTTTVQHQDTEGHTAMLHNNYPAYPKTSLSSQYLPLPTNEMHLVHSVCKSPIDQESNAGSDTETSTPDKIASNVQLPVCTNSTSDGISGNQQTRTGDCSEDNPQVNSEQEGNGSTKISLLDFWISKILMERSIENSQPRKPCNVDYICTANGEKRIRLRLVDLMEMQVEQSMKA